MDLHKAIRAIHSNVITINGETQETIIAKDSSGNDVVINWTQVNQQILIIAFNKAMEDLRAKRDKLLADTDYTVLQDSTYTDAQVAEWVIYRQALRDITNGLTTKQQVEAVVFPNKPQGII